MDHEQAKRTAAGAGPGYVGSDATGEPVNSAEAIGDALALLQEYELSLRNGGDSDGEAERVAIAIRNLRALIRQVPATFALTKDSIANKAKRLDNQNCQ